MRTTITVNDAIFTDLMRFSAAKTRNEAINGALSEWVRRKKIEQLRALRGKLDIAADLEGLRQLEIDETAALYD